MDKPVAPPNRIRLGHTGVEWNADEPRPAAAKRHTIAENLVWGSLVAAVALGWIAVIAWPFA